MVLILSKLGWKSKQKQDNLGRKKTHIPIDFPIAKAKIDRDVSFFQPNLSNFDKLSTIR